MVKVFDLKIFESFFGKIIRKMVKCFFFKYFYGICIKGVIFKEICVLKFNEFDLVEEK